MTESKSKDKSKDKPNEKSGNDLWKTCSRGHQYKGASGCPMCWKLNRPRPADTNTLGLKR